MALPAVGATVEISGLRDLGELNGVRCTVLEHRPGDDGSLQALVDAGPLAGRVLLRAANLVAAPDEDRELRMDWMWGAQWLLSLFHCDKYNPEKAVAALSKRERAWVIDFFARTLTQVRPQPSGAQSLAQIGGPEAKGFAAQQLYRCEREPGDARRAALRFFKAEHPYELVFPSSAERQRFCECVRALRHSLLWCPSLARGAQGPLWVEVSGSQEVPIAGGSQGERHTVQGTCKLRVSPNPTDTVRLWAGCIDMQQALLPAQSDLRSWMPPGYDIYVIGFEDVPPQVRKPELSARVRAHLGDDVIPLLTTEEEPDKRGQAHSVALVVLATKSKALRVSSTGAFNASHDRTQGGGVGGLLAGKSKETAKTDSVAVCFAVNETSLCFCLAKLHTLAHDAKGEAVAARRQIMREFFAGVEVGPASGGELCCRFDHVFALGGLGLGFDRGAGEPWHAPERLSELRPGDGGGDRLQLEIARSAEQAGAGLLHGFQEADMKLDPRLGEGVLEQRVLCKSRKGLSAGPGEYRCCVVGRGQGEGVGLRAVSCEYNLPAQLLWAECFAPPSAIRNVTLTSCTVECDVGEAGSWEMSGRRLSRPHLSVWAEWAEVPLRQAALAGTEVGSPQLPRTAGLSFDPATHSIEWLRRQYLVISVHDGSGGPLLGSAAVCLGDSLAPDGFANGVVVEAQGLRNSVELNGAWGEVVGRRATPQGAVDIIVQFGKPHNTKRALRTSCLTVVEGQRDTGAPFLAELELHGIRAAARLRGAIRVDSDPTPPTRAMAQVPGEEERQRPEVQAAEAEAWAALMAEAEQELGTVGERAAARIQREMEELEREEQQRRSELEDGAGAEWDELAEQEREEFARVVAPILARQAVLDGEHEAREEIEDDEAAARVALIQAFQEGEEAAEAAAAAKAALQEEEEEARGEIEAEEEEERSELLDRIQRAQAELQAWLERRDEMIRQAAEDLSEAEQEGRAAVEDDEAAARVALRAAALQQQAAIERELELREVLRMLQATLDGEGAERRRIQEDEQMEWDGLMADALLSQRCAEHRRVAREHEQRLRAARDAQEADESAGRRAIEEEEAVAARRFRELLEADRRASEIRAAAAEAQRAAERAEHEAAERDGRARRVRLEAEERAKLSIAFAAALRDAQRAASAREARDAAGRGSVERDEAEQREEVEGDEEAARRLLRDRARHAAALAAAAERERRGRDAAAATSHAERVGRGQLAAAERAAFEALARELEAGGQSASGALLRRHYLERRAAGDGEEEARIEVELAERAGWELLLQCARVEGDDARRRLAERERAECAGRGFIAEQELCIRTRLAELERESRRDARRATQARQRAEARDRMQTECAEEQGRHSVTVEEQQERVALRDAFAQAALRAAAAEERRRRDLALDAQGVARLESRDRGRLAGTEQDQRAVLESAVRRLNTALWRAADAASSAREWVSSEGARREAICDAEDAAWEDLVVGCYEGRQRAAQRATERASRFRAGARGQAAAHAMSAAALALQEHQGRVAAAEQQEREWRGATAAAEGGEREDLERAERQQRRAARRRQAGRECVAGELCLAEAAAREAEEHDEDDARRALWALWGDPLGLAIRVAHPYVPRGSGAGTPGARSAASSAAGAWADGVAAAVPPAPPPGFAVLALRGAAAAVDADQGASDAVSSDESSSSGFGTQLPLAAAAAAAEARQHRRAARTLSQVIPAPPARQQSLRSRAAMLELSVSQESLRPPPRQQSLRSAAAALELPADSRPGSRRPSHRELLADVVPPPPAAAAVAKAAVATAQRRRGSSTAVHAAPAPAAHPAAPAARSSASQSSDGAAQHAAAELLDGERRARAALRIAEGTERELLLWECRSELATAGSPCGHHGAHAPPPSRPLTSGVPPAGAPSPHSAAAAEAALWAACQALLAASPARAPAPGSMLPSAGAAAPVAVVSAAWPDSTTDEDGAGDAADYAAFCEVAAGLAADSPSPRRIPPTPGGEGSCVVALSSLPEGEAEEPDELLPHQASSSPQPARRRTADCSAQPVRLPQPQPCRPRQRRLRRRGSSRGAPPAPQQPQTQATALVTAPPSPQPPQLASSGRNNGSRQSATQAPRAGGDKTAGEPAAQDAWVDDDTSVPPDPSPTRPGGSTGPGPSPTCSSGWRGALLSPPRQQREPLPRGLPTTPALRTTPAAPAPRTSVPPAASPPQPAVPGELPHTPAAGRLSLSPHPRGAVPLVSPPPPQPAGARESPEPSPLHGSAPRGGRSASSTSATAWPDAWDECAAESDVPRAAGEAAQRPSPSGGATPLRLVEGCVVEAHSLRSAELNGRQGVVRGFAQGRVVVDFGTGSDSPRRLRLPLRQLRAEKLRVVAPPPPPRPQPELRAPPPPPPAQPPPAFQPQQQQQQREPQRHGSPSGCSASASLGYTTHGYSTHGYTSGGGRGQHPPHRRAHGSGATQRGAELLRLASLLSAARARRDTVWREPPDPTAAGAVHSSVSRSPQRLQPQQAGGSPATALRAAPGLPRAVGWE
eukprot:TRINITY_DN17470_c0_g1_i1.p1 TRINITY_DN17470_c0_g1~~TRINITY_DN17470_c0_g1_i1.p1  ORF type:complete len:2555 (+),score=718.32 TRINITY_DN17470_c0_g1_i1:105-7667(+)